MRSVWFRRWRTWLALVYALYALGVVCWWFLFGRLHAFHAGGVFITAGVVAAGAIVLPGLALFALPRRT